MQEIQMARAHRLDYADSYSDSTLNSWSDGTVSAVASIQRVIDTGQAWMHSRNASHTYVFYWCLLARGGHGQLPSFICRSVHHTSGHHEKQISQAGVESSMTSTKRSRFCRPRQEPVSRARLPKRVGSDPRGLYPRSIGASGSSGSPGNATIQRVFLKGKHAVMDASTVETERTRQRGGVVGTEQRCCRGRGTAGQGIGKPQEPRVSSAIPAERK